MFKGLKSEQWIFDIEYVPDVDMLRRIYQAAEGTSDEAVMAMAYADAPGYDISDNPEPMLKLMFYKVVSISTIIRDVVNPEKLKFFTLDEESISEKEMLTRFLAGVGEKQPQLVGWASARFDIPVLFQRALVNGVLMKGFCERPERPWEGPDFFARYNDWNIDLMDVIGCGRGFPKLADFALATGIPGKMGVDGSKVAGMWAKGKFREVIDYNECDTATTYLVFLEVARSGGFISSKRYHQERRILRDLMANSAKPHFQMFLEEWKKLRDQTGREL